MAENYKDRIYFGTVLLERNRWVTGERRPSLAVSDWTQRIADDGFDGLELWENHAVLTSDDERQKLLNSPVPVKLFNSYDRCEDETLAARRRAAELAGFFHAEGMKFNFGRDPDGHERYVRTVMDWRSMLPRDFRFLCECHGGTTMEDPERAAETFERMGRNEYEVIIHGFGGLAEGVKNLFRCHGGRITHIHVNLSPKGPIPEADVRERVVLLRQLGFRGSHTIEFTEGVGDGAESMDVLYRNAVRDMRMLRMCLERG